MRSKIAWLILALLLLTPVGELRGQDKEVGGLRFKGEAAVAGEYITLGHLADLPPELAQKCGQALVWSAPPPGQVYTLTGEFLKYRLDQWGLAEFLAGAAFPAAILVTQTGVLLPPEKVAQAFKGYVIGHSQWPEKNLRIEVFPLEEPVILPDQEVGLEALPPKGGRLLGEVTLELVLLKGGQPVRRLKAAGKVSLEREVVCATRPLKPHDIVQARDVQLHRRDVTTLTAADFFVSLEQVVGRTLARAVGPQEILTSRHLSSQPLINRGDEVTVLLDEDGLSVSTKGVAQEAGYAGRQIRLVNPKSKKEFQAQVVDAKTVKVTL